MACQQAETNGNESIYSVWKKGGDLNRKDKTDERAREWSLSEHIVQTLQLLLLTVVLVIHRTPVAQKQNK